VQTGSATRYDELSTDVRITTLQSQRIDAERQLNKQTIGLKQLLGIEGGVQLELNGEFSPGTEPLQDEQSEIASAMGRRPEVRQAAQAEKAAELNRRLSAMGAVPTISGHASIGYTNGIYLPELNTPVLNWVVGVQVNVPIFQGFLISKQEEEAEKKLDAARENSLEVRRNVTTQVLQAIEDVGAARQQMESAQVQLEQAREMLEVVKVQYDLGLLTNLEYLDGQESLERAQLASIQAQYLEVLSEYALKQATGAILWEPAGSVGGQ
jgi:outer membrane protein TolC